jgi:LysM repeat protein
MNAIELAGTQTAIATSGAALLPVPAAGTPEAGSTQPVAPAGEPTYTPLAGVDTNPVVSTPMPSVTSQAPAANTPVSQSGGQVSNPGTYSLHEGEYPYCLARRFNVDPVQLLTLNGLSSGQSYYPPGTNISIPQSGAAFPGTRARKAHPAQYTVHAGDTIYSIACDFGDADPLAIASANNLSSPYTLTSGASIQIP